MRGSGWSRPLPKTRRGTVSPVLHLAANSFNIFTTTNGTNHWRRRLCAGILSKSPAPLLAPSWDKKNKKTRFILMLPQLARTVLAEFDSMDKQLQATVTALPLEAVTKPSPTKALLKKRARTSCEKIEELTGAVASLEAENTTLQGALRDEV